MSKQKGEQEQPINPSQWKLHQPYNAKTVGILIVLFVILIHTGKNTEVPRMISSTFEWAQDLVGLKETSEIGRGTQKLAEKMFPPVISERQELSRIDDFDPDNLPLFSHVEKEVQIYKEYNTDTLELEEVREEKEVLVKRFGYLVHVIKKMYDSLEIALWGTIIAIIVSIPLAYCSSANYAPNKPIYHAARAFVSLLRAVPELISALFLVLAFGFGPVAGILALGFHCAGFFGKFYAEDIENADRGPQDVMLAVNAGKIKTLLYGVFPQVFPQYVAYTLYIVDRNVRMAIVVGIVGAGGIGMELKGRFDMFDYGHVCTILIALFVTVFSLDILSAKIRQSLIKENNK